jgi:hypothetical protein
MKTIKECKIELAASQDQTRAAIGSPYLEIKDGKGTLVVTDGKILAYMPVEVDEYDVSGYVTKEALVAARKTTLRSMDCTAGTLAVHGGPTFPRPTDHTFPNWRQVVPADYEKPLATIALDAKLLWQLAQAMGTQGVKIVIQANDKPFLVYPQDCGPFSKAPKRACDEARGVIVPIRVG